MTITQFRKIFLHSLGSVLQSNLIGSLLSMLSTRTLALDATESSQLVTIINELKISGGLSVDEERYLTEIFQIVFVEEGTLNYINPSLGESKYIDVTLIADDNWTEYNIVVKDDTTMDYISAINIVGLDYASFGNVPPYTQRIQIDNFGSQLTTGTLHKGVVQLEVGNESGDATGDCVSVLSEFYYTLKKNDVDE